MSSPPHRAPLPTLPDRQAGIVCHLSSIPGRFGLGTMGAEARAFVDALSDAGLAIWQILPLNPVNEEGSPYQSKSSRAMNPAFIDFDELGEFGCPVAPNVEGDAQRLDFDAVAKHRHDFRPALADWFWTSQSAKDLRADAATFFATSDWLDEFVAFELISQRQGADVDWWQWPEEFRARDPEAVADAEKANPDLANAIRAEQFLLHHQWQSLRRFARTKGVQIMGDLPIYVAANSADTWAHPAQFQLHPDGSPRAVAGVPPDYFAMDGQLWGNPLYDWDVMARDGYSWWHRRLAHASDQFDWVRIDHFRGFADYWLVPADAESAREGHWVAGPGRAVFDAAEDVTGRMRIVAEDLGDIDARVTALRNGLGYPGMRVVQFAFDGGSDNPHRMHNHEENAACYLSTHDNPTTRAWLERLPEERRADIAKACGASPEETHADIVKRLIDLAFSSHARLAFVCLQDAFALGEEAIMNRPGESDGNWAWRLNPALNLAASLADIGAAARRAGR